MSKLAILGWWRGQHGNKIGWFPSNYTQEELEDAHTYCMAENILDIMVSKLKDSIKSSVKKVVVCCILQLSIYNLFSNVGRLVHVQGAE